MEYIESLVQVIEKLLEPEYVLQNNVIPLVLSTVHHLIGNYPDDQAVQTTCFNLMLMFADGLKISNDEITSLLNEEFQLFLEIVHSFRLLQTQDLMNLDRLIQTIVIDHIEIEDQIEVLDYFNNLEENNWVITCLV